MPKTKTDLEAEIAALRRENADLRQQRADLEGALTDATTNQDGWRARVADLEAEVEREAGGREYEAIRRDADVERLEDLIIKIIREMKG